MAFDDRLNELFGVGIRLPLRVDQRGALDQVEGEAALFQGVQEILDTPQGTRPFDPTFGVPELVYDPTSDARSVAWAIGLAIERNEPRAKDIEVAIVSEDADAGTIFLNVVITPIGTNVPLNKIFPVFRLQ